MKSTKKLLAIVLAVMMLLSMFTMVTSAKSVELATTKESDLVFTVAGSGGLCGSNWDPSDYTNDMTLNEDNIFEKVFTGIDAGAHEFKVVKDHYWGTSYSHEGLYGSNCVVEVLYDDATVTVYFDYSTEIVSWAVEYPNIETIPYTEPETVEPTEPATDEPTEEETQVETEAPTEIESEIPTEAETDFDYIDPDDSETGSIYDATWVVVGSKELTGYDWESDPEKAPENVMGNSWGTFSKFMYDVPAGEIHEFMLCANFENGAQQWFGDENGQPIAVYVEKSDCDSDIYTGSFGISFSPEHNNADAGQINVVDCIKIDWDTIDKVYGLRQIDHELTSVTLDWADIKNVQKYWVFVDGKVVASTTDSTFKVNNLEVDSFYEFSVTGLLEDGRVLSLENADVCQGYTKSLIPYSVSDANWISLTWDEEFDKTWIYYGEDEDNLKLCASTTENYYTIRNLKPETMYEYKIVGYIDGKYIASNVYCIYTFYSVIPSVNVNYADGEYSVSWSEYDGTYKYWVIVETADKTYTYATTDTYYAITGAEMDCTVTVKGYNGTKMIEYYPFEYTAG